MAAKKFRLLLLDANVVIYLFKAGLWERLIERCDVSLSRIVADEEAQFFEESDGTKHYIDLYEYTDNDRIRVVEASLSDVRSFRERFDDNYMSRLDDGEAESLAFLLNSRDEYLICSGDSIVFKVLAVLAMTERGISLEEIFHSIGLTQQLPREFTKSYREHWTSIGSQDSIQDRGLKATASEDQQD